VEIVDWCFDETVVDFVEVDDEAGLEVLV